MFAKCFALFVFIGLAQQGLAFSYPNEYDAYIDYAGSALQAVASVSGSNTDLTKGVTYCKTVFYDTISEVGKYLELLTGFIPEARQYYSNYKDCSQVKEPAAADVCREATKWEYYDLVKTRFGNLGRSLSSIVGNAVKLPTCLFTDKY